MKHVSILLLDHVNIGSMENARHGLLEANNFQRLNGMDNFFKVELVGLKPEVNLYGNAFTLRADKTIEQVKKTDLIIVPPVQRDLASGIRDNEGFCSWLRTQYEEGAEIATLCLGAFLLGKTGLLNGRKCVTHWKASSQFKKLFPLARLVPDKLLTDDAGIYTGGGAFSSANLILYVIEKYISREAAIYCSKIFQIDMGRNNQSEFMIFTGQKDHTDDQVKIVQEYVERNFPEKFSVVDICDRFFLGRRTLERRFKHATGNTLLEYLQRVRVEAAKRNLEKTNKTISEIMYDVGYSDPKSFREVFKKYSGLSPIEYKSKYGPN